MTVLLNLIGYVSLIDWILPIVFTAGESSRTIQEAGRISLREGKDVPDSVTNLLLLFKAPSHQRDARSAHRKIKNMASASSCVELLSKFGRSWRVDNACTACCWRAGRMQCACIAHTERAC